MAIHESDREDLMREAVALARRIELRLEDEAESVICGFRRSGALAIYFGADPVYQFDEAARLRRAFASGLLYRTQGSTLAELKRHRTNNVTELLRRDLSSHELNSFLNAMRHRVRQFFDAIQTGSAEIIAQYPADDSILPDLIDAVRRTIEMDGQLAPQIKGKR